MNREKLGQGLIKIHLLRILIGCLLLNAVVFGLLVLPGKARRIWLQSQLQTLDLQVAAARHRNELLKSRVTGLEQAQKDLQYLYTKVFESEKTGPTEIRLELEDLAQKAQIKRGDFTYGYDRLEQYRLQRFNLGVPVEGSYRNIRQFINSIERSKHFLILERVELSAEKQNPNSVNLDFRLSTYLVENAS